jgi:hypothetical protein
MCVRVGIKGRSSWSEQEKGDNSQAGIISAFTKITENKLFSAGAYSW